MKRTRKRKQKRKRKIKWKEEEKEKENEKEKEKKKKKKEKKKNGVASLKNGEAIIITVSFKSVEQRYEYYGNDEKHQILEAKET